MEVVIETKEEQMPDGGPVDAQHIQRCFDCIASVVALRATWVGTSPAHIGRTLIDALFAALSLDLVYMQFDASEGVPPVRDARSTLEVSVASIDACLREQLGADAKRWPRSASVRFGGTALSIATVPFEAAGASGVLVAASEQPSFPTKSEALVLDISAEQVLLALHERHRANEARYRPGDFQGIVDLIPIPFAVTGPTGEVEEMNQNAFDFFGMTLEKLEGGESRDVMHPDDRERVFAAHRAVAANGAFDHDAAHRRAGSRYPLQIEWRARRSDGVYRWVESRAYPLRDTSGSVVRWYSLFNDVDDRKRAEDALAASERELRNIVDTIPGMVAVFTSSGTLEYCNRQLLDYFGATAEQLAAWQEGGFTHPEDGPREVAGFTRAIAAGEPFAWETRARRSDGVYRWFQSRGFPLRDASGHIVRWYNLLTDIDDRKRAEDTLAASERETRLIVNSIPGLVTVFSAAGKLEAVSSQVLEYFGGTLEDHTTWSGRGHIHPDDTPRAVEVFSCSIACGEPFEMEVRARRFDGVYRWFQSRGSPLRDATGRIARWYNLLTDIDERKRAEDALAASERELRNIIDTIPGMVAVFTSSGTLEYVNRQVVDYYGATSEELAASQEGGASHSEENPHDVAVFTRAIAEGEPFELETRARRSDGVYRWFQSRGFPLRDASGRIVRWYNLLTDIDERKRAEDALAAREQDLRLIVNSIPAGLALMSPSGEVEVVNETLRAYFGKTFDELLRWGTSDAVHPEDLPRVMKAFEYSLGTDVPYDVEQRQRRFDGTYRWFQVRGRPLRDGNGKIVRWYVLHVDIDERKRAEETLKQKEIETRLIVDNIAGGVAVFSPDDELESINQYLLGYTGQTLEELKRWKAANIVHPDDLQRVKDGHSSEGMAREQNAYEVRVRRFDGAYRWFQSRGVALRDPGGRIVRSYRLLIDIDDSRRAEEALAASERDLRLIMDSIPGMVAVFSASGALESVNKQVLDYFGAKQADLEEWATGSFAFSEDRTRDAEAFSRSIATGAPFQWETRVRRSDGLHRWFQIRGHAARDAGGQVVRWYALLTDINDLKSAEEALNKVRSELAYAARAMSLGVLTASITHEVSQPLSGIVTNASTCLRMLKAEPPDLEGALATVQRTVRDGNRAADVVARVRSLFGKKELAAEHVDLNEATREVLALTRHELQKNRVLLHLRLDDDLPALVGDRVQLQQVILNLLLNASDATRAVVDRPPEVFVETTRDVDAVRFAVRDTGVGIQPEAHGKLFEPFFTTKTQGMGIGLSVSRSIVERHGGRLWATNNDGPGATFGFSIPCAPHTLPDMPR